MVGEEFDGRYKILRKLGAGGMGEVYLAEHLILKRREAIKVVRSRLARNEDYLARFRREARATNRVQHPNIVSVYDFGRLPDGRLYLTMELADGPSLEETLKSEGRFTVPRAVHVLRQLAEAIGFAHERGVIHRDLKPDNLVLVNRGHATDHLKILDFGVAKIIAPEYLESAAISREGELFGTPAYVAPEQIRGVRDDPRIDIYAMGCIAYELLTGSVPFIGRPMDVLEAHLEERPIVLSQRCPEARIPPRLEEIVLQCLEKDVQRRFQTGAQIAEALGRVPVSERRATSAGGLRPRARTDSSPPSAFTDEPTLETPPGSWWVPPDDDEADTTDVYPARAAAKLRDVYRELAENVCDLGAPNPELLVCLAELNQLEHECLALDAELDDLQRRAGHIVQSVREREASLRFAIGELRFGQEGVGGETGVRRAMDVLRLRLSTINEQSRRELGAITEKQISLTAARARQTEGLDALHGQLAALVDQVADAYRGQAAIDQLITRRDELVESAKRHTA